MDFKKDKLETIDEYCHRISKMKDELSLTWPRIKEIIDENTGLNLTADGYRKKELAYLNEQPQDLLDLNDLALEIKKDRIKARDERAQTNALIRRISREETLKEIALEAANAIKLELPKRTKVKAKANKEAILEISDWHYGIEINNLWNKYDPDIAKRRIAQLRDEVIEKVASQGVTTLHVVNMGDMISGRIHTSIRINNRIDVITQTIEVSELIAQLLNDLAEVVNIKYYDTLDNHSRLEPNLKESLDLESLARITTWFLKERLKGSKNIEFNDNVFGDDIVTFESLGHRIIAVHGDKDKPAKVINSMYTMTKVDYDLVCMAHLHHFSANEQNMCRMVCNGSLMGTDDFAERLRLTSKPSQNLIIVTEDNVTDCIYVIDLD